MMGSQRSDKDSWDIASSVGATAVMVAAGRAAETRRPDALIYDPYAELLVAAAGTGVWEHMVDDTVLDALANRDPELAAVIEHLRTYQAVRTHFFDRFFANAASAAITQMVILGSGLDTRAYRLPWPRRIVLYEIDQPKVLQFKAETLAGHGVSPTVTLREIGIDLREDWVSALRDAGFDESRPAAWLAEGLLMYLPAAAQDLLFERITALGAPGTLVAVEIISDDAPMRSDDMVARFETLRNAVGLPDGGDVRDLTYDDPDRADVADWLSEHGWRATAISARDVRLRLGRTSGLPVKQDAAFARFVTALRT